MNKEQIFCSINKTIYVLSEEFQQSIIENHCERNNPQIFLCWWGTEN